MLSSEYEARIFSLLPMPDVLTPLANTLPFSSTSNSRCGRSAAIPSFVTDGTTLSMVSNSQSPNISEFNLSCSSLPTSYRMASEIITNARSRSEEHTSELQSRGHLVCRLLLEKKIYLHM